MVKNNLIERNKLLLTKSAGFLYTNKTKTKKLVKVPMKIFQNFTNIKGTDKQLFDNQIKISHMTFLKYLDQINNNGLIYKYDINYQLRTYYSIQFVKFFTL